MYIKQDNVTAGNILKGASLVLFSLFAIVVIFITKIRDNYTLNHSQTAVGTTLQMKRTGASWTIGGYYTDKSKSFLAGTFSIDKASSALLPYKSSSYLVTTTTDVGKKEVPAIFGRMNTDGDFYFIIPYPKKGTYNIAITNIEAMQDESTINVKEILADKKSVSDIVSDANKDTDLTSSEEDSKLNDKVTDTIGFNMSINPALDGDKYQPTVLNYETLLKKNESGKVVFDFEAFWRSVYKEPPLKKARKQQEEVQKQVDEITKSIAKVADTIEKNPDDEASKTRLEQLNTKLATLENSLEKANNEIRKARRLAYSEDFYSDYSTKMFYVE